jgi:acetoacetyl-CoA reductase
MNRIAVVTGATRGIGFTISKKLSEQGFFVVGLSRTLSSETQESWVNSLSNDCMLYKCNVANIEDVEKFIAELHLLDGTVELLINNAGITRDGVFHKMSTDEWKNVIDTNLNSLFYITQPIYKMMKDKRSGKIINISSVNGQKGQAGQVNYSSSKAGVHGFTMALAQEGARNNILVNTVSPGYTNTEMMKGIRPDVLQDIKNNIPLARLAEPEEIANVVAFLADSNCSYITGANIPVNGGLFIG